MPLPRTNLRTNRQVVEVSLILLSLIAVVALVGMELYARQTQPAIQPINYTQLRDIADGVSAAAVTIEGELVTVTSKEGVISQAVVDRAAQQEIANTFAKNKVQVEYLSTRPNAFERVLSWIIPIGVLLALCVLGWRVYASMGGNGTLQMADVAGAQSVTFQDVAGVDEARNELSETIDFLRDPATFGRLGGRAPRGILLSGPPGTGKTLLARAAAGEAKVPFLSVSGSGFQEKFAGLGAARVRRLFAKARQIAPCVVFIDEIDALGRRRGRGGDSASADQDQTLNQLLVEMDGFDSVSGVVVIASTNRPDILDSALTRPGRFDREIVVNLADMRGREQILQVHARGLKIEEGLDFGWIARGTPGFSGADLANLLNEAAIAATRDGAMAIGRTHVEHARDKILMGVERQGFMMDQEERYATAVHEAGHVAVGLAMKHGDPIHKVSILPRGRALGVTQALPERDRLMKKREYLEDQIAMLLGGRAAEMLLLDTMTAGASNDIERAVEIARKMVAEFGMSPLGPIHLGRPEDARSQTLLDRVEEATGAIISEQLKRACDVVDASREGIAELVKGLMERDTLEAEEIHSSFGLKSNVAA
jgi:cell division protease FtsH